MENKVNFTRLEAQPFSITFTWKFKSTTITLKDGADVLKLADIFSELLVKYDIYHDITTKDFNAGTGETEH